jgi:hypothetical protein
MVTFQRVGGSGDDRVSQRSEPGAGHAFPAPRREGAPCLPILPGVSACHPVTGNPRLPLPRGCGRDRTCRAFAPALQAGCTSQVLHTLIKHTVVTEDPYEQCHAATTDDGGNYAPNE